VSSLLIAFLGAALTGNQPTTVSNVVGVTEGSSEKSQNASGAVEKEYQKLLEDDDAAQEEVDQWIRENNDFAAKGAGASNAALNRRIRERFEPVRKGYEDLLKRHPEHTKGHIAYGTFLNDLGDEDGAQEQYEKALKLDPKDPAIYNNLAGIYSHHGPITNAFDYYAKAIELNPREPLYYHNLGTAVYLFRKDAKEFYGINEQQVFDKALKLYSNSMRLDPKNFPLASDIAQTYYGIKPARMDEALNAWTNALRLANDEVEREGVHIHFARLKLQVGKFAEARAHLNSITNEMYADLKKKIGRNIDEQEKEKAQTNAAPAGGISKERKN